MSSSEVLHKFELNEEFAGCFVDCKPPLLDFFERVYITIWKHSAVKQYLAPVSQRGTAMTVFN